MTIETEFKALVKALVEQHAVFDAAQQAYIGAPEKGVLLKIDHEFNVLIKKMLRKNALDQGAIDQNYKLLTRVVHPDKVHSFIPEIVWLEHQLSEGCNDGICFKILGSCYENLASPEPSKSFEFSEVRDLEDMKRWLEMLKSEAKSYSERSFYGSLLGLLNQSVDYFDEMGKIKPKGARSLMMFLPMIFASYGAFIMGSQVSVLYAFYFILFKSGQNIEHNPLLADWRPVAKTLQDTSIMSATMTTTLLVHLLEIIFWGTRQSYITSLQIGSSLLNPLTKPSISTEYYQSQDSFFEDLKKARQNKDVGSTFQTAEFNLITAPLEAYIESNKKQYLNGWRAGGDKGEMIKAILFKMRVLDKDDKPLESKLIKAKNELCEIKKYPDVYTKKTALAINQAESVIALLQEDINPSLQIVKCS